MPFYKDSVFFKDNLDVRFEPVPDGQELTLYDGIYRCTGCGHEKVMREGECLNICELCSNPDARWQLVCAPAIAGKHL